MVLQDDGGGPLAKVFSECPSAKVFGKGDVGVDAEGVGVVPFAEGLRSHVKMHLS